MGNFPRYIWVKGRRLYFYNSFGSFYGALKVAKYFQKKNKTNYFILTVETFHTGSKRYGLYMNKVIGLV